MFAAIWGSPMVIDGKVYLGDEDGDVVVLAADRTMKVIAEINMGSSVYSTPVPANGTLFIVNRNQLFALANLVKRAAENARINVRQRERGKCSADLAPRVPDASSARRIALACTGCCRFSVLATSADPSPQNWPAFRGAEARGIVAGATPPSTWNLDAFHECRLEDDHPRPRPLQPDRLGRSHLRHDGGGGESGSRASSPGIRVKRALIPRPTWSATRGDLIAIDRASGQILWNRVVA